MPRAKKDGKFLNCYVDKEILEKLEQYCEKTSIPKTSVVEKALSQYLMQFEALMDKKKRIDRIFSQYYDENGNLK